MAEEANQAQYRDVRRPSGPPALLATSFIALVAAGVSTYFDSPAVYAYICYLAPLAVLAATNRLSRLEFRVLAAALPLLLFGLIFAVVSLDVRFEALYVLGGLSLGIIAARCYRMAPMRFAYSCNVVLLAAALYLLARGLVGGVSPDDLVASSRNNIVTLLGLLSATSIVATHLSRERSLSALTTAAVMTAGITMGLLTGRAGVMVGAALAVIAVAANYRPSRAVSLGLASLGLLIALGGWGALSPDANTDIAFESGLERLERLGLESARTEIWIAVGAHATEPAYYFGFPRGFSQEVTGYRQPHNSYLSVLLAHGFLGLVVTAIALGLLVLFVARRSVVVVAVILVLLARAATDIALSAPLYIPTIIFAMLASAADRSRGG